VFCGIAKGRAKVTYTKILPNFAGIRDIILFLLFGPVCLHKKKLLFFVFYFCAIFAAISPKNFPCGAFA
jgi:hypothetical protein